MAAPYSHDVSEQRRSTQVPLWLTGVAMTGLSALVVAAGIFWTLVTAPQHLVGAESPAFVLAFGRWAWHLVYAIAAWM